MVAKAGMFFYALAFLLGVVIVQQLPEIVAIAPAVLLLAALSCLLFWLLCSGLKNRYCRLFYQELTLIIVFIILIIIGFIYTSIYANQQLSHRLNESLSGQNIIVTGRIISIPVTGENSQRFEFRLSSFQLLAADAAELDTEAVPQKIRISWYYGQPVKAGEFWQFEVRLKPPHGFINAGGFDYEAWLFQHGLHATGYVRKSSLNERLDSSAGHSVAAGIDHTRQSLVNTINELSSGVAAQPGFQQTKDSMFALIKALALGDKSSITPQQWQVLSRTGTSHLMAISGLHIGLAALFAYAAIRRLLPGKLMQRVPAQHVAIIGGMLSASLYAMLSGFSIPAQRALIMLFVLSIMALLRRNHRPFDALGFALLLVLLFDPLAVLSIGFWFSFSAVGVIFLSLNTSSTENNDALKAGQTGWLFYSCLRFKQILLRWVFLQLMISVFLLPLSLFMFQQASLVSPLVNLLLIPYVSFLVVPVVLLAMIMAFIIPAAAELLFQLAASLLALIWPLLSALADLPYAIWVQGGVSVFSVLLATAGLLVLYYIRPLSNVVISRVSSPVTRYCTFCLLALTASVMFLSLFVSSKKAIASDEYRVTVLDVGQGLAAVIETQNHVAVYDSGARFSERMDAGSSVVLPYLRSRGVTALDQLIISHGDADHIGGAQALIEHYPEVELTGQDIDKLNTANGQPCEEGMQWQWDDVLFRFLSPSIKAADAVKNEKRNNRSCVLQVSSAAGTVLFTGDIEKKVELSLLNQHSTELKSQVLVVPHHGSKTSSSTAFIASVAPEIAIFSVGYKNRYRLPNEQVLHRYQRQGSRLLRTDAAGAITVKMNNNNEITIEKHRYKLAKYWHHRPH